MQNDISKEFSLGGLLRFTFPTIIMMMFVATYIIADGIFVSRFVGTAALSAINIVYPLINVMLGVGIMLGTGGSAIIGRELGAGKEDLARRHFTLLTLFAIAMGLILSLLCFVFIEPLSIFLGADEALLPYCIDYGRIMMAFYSISVVQVLFQVFFVTSGKPKLGLVLNVASGISNIVFDYVFIVLMDMGIKGAAWGTVTSFLIGGIPPLIYFLKPRAVLYFVKPEWNTQVLLHSMSNGVSELITNISSGVTTYLFNKVMMQMMGQDGVAAITIILYAKFLFASAYMGFSNGVAPVFSYQYGRRNHVQLKRLFKMSMGIILVSSAVISVLSFLLAEPTILVFTSRESSTFTLTLDGYKICAWNFLFCGVNIFTSAFFTALSNGVLSALISSLRTFVCVSGCILFLPKYLDLLGVWLAIPVAEVLTIVVAIILFVGARKKYQYA